jgi:hypothetical protein
MPVIVFGLLNIEKHYPFLLFTFLAAISTYFAYLLPFDTAHKPLDSNI